MNDAAADTHYDRLGIPETATPEQIKRAYFAAVRQHRPEQYPELFQRLTESARILGDAQKRGEYDQKRRGGRRVQALLDQAAGILGKDPHKALATLKGAIAMAPDLPRPRLLYAQTLLRIEDWAGAEKQFRWLLKNTGKSEALHGKLARCLLSQDRFADAHAEVRAALVINPAWYDGLFLQARIYEAQEDWEKAAHALEEAVRADGRENFADFDALVRLWEVHHKAGTSEDIDRAAHRIVLVVPLPTNGQDLRADVQSARAVLRLCDRALELSDTGKDFMASALLYVAARIEGADDDAQSRMADLQARTQVLFEARQAQSDVLIDGPLRNSIFLKYLDRRGSDAARQTRLENVLSELQTQINAEPKKLTAAIEYLKKEYPRLAEAEAALLNVLLTRAVRRIEVLNPAPHSAAEGGIMPGAAPPAGPEAPPANNSGKILRWLRGGGNGGQ